MRVEIEAERMLLGFSKKEMADKLHVTERTYNNKIRGITPFTAIELEILADMTDESIDYLLGRKRLEKQTSTV